MRDVEYVRQYNITNVVTLNRSWREDNKNSEEFCIKTGIQHDRVEFEDGGVPTDAEMEKVLEILENAKGVTVIHCACTANNIL